MNPEMIQLSIPIPPAPLLERAVGYQNTRKARFLALWWEPAGDEAMVSDGFVTFTGDWPGYLAYVQHKSVYPHLALYNLGSSDEPAEYHLLVDLLERKAYIAKSREAEKALAQQWGQGSTQDEPAVTSMEEFEELLQSFVEQIQAIPSMDEIRKRMEEDRQAVEMLVHWLDDHAEKRVNGSSGHKRSRL